MPIAGPLMGNLIKLEMFKAGLVGEKVQQMANAIGNAVVTSFLSSAIYTGTSTGLGLGAGTSTGKISSGVVTGTIVGKAIFANMGLKGLVGEKAKPLATAIGNGVANHMATALVTGASTVVGIGTGTGTIVGIVEPNLSGAIALQLFNMGFTGRKVIQLAQAIGAGITIVTSSSIVNTTITGVAVGTVPPAFPPIPSQGIDTGKIV